MEENGRDLISSNVFRLLPVKTGKIHEKIQ
jgi:hypothetical protein